MLDQASDQAATQAAAIVLHKLPEALKAAIRLLVAEWRRDLIDYILTEKWVRLLTALLFLLGVIGLWLKEKT